MGLGVLSDRKLAHVPGTVILDDHTAHAEQVTHGLKRGTGRNAHIVLNPQPSDNPNDPLNWPLFKKEVIIAILTLGGMLNAATNGPLLNASFFPISQQLGMPISQVVLVSGYNLLAAGCIGPFACALSRKYGKRPVYLASTLFGIIGTAIGESKISYNYLLAARIVQGFSTSAFESLLVATIGDLYFVHERGARLAIVNFVLNAANGLATIICGQVFQSLGWLWLFHLFQIFLVIQFCLMLFFSPETTFLRDARYETDLGRDEKNTEMDKIEKVDTLDKSQAQFVEDTLPKRAEAETSEVSSHSRSSEAIIPKKTFVQEMAVYTGVYHNDSFVKDLAGPFLTLTNPAACYAIITSGLLNAWYVGCAIIQSGIFSGPPWNYSSAQVGYLGTGPFLGGLIAAIFTGACSDPIIKWMTRKNNGVYEPEFRLVFMSVSCVLCAIGMFSWGYAASIGANAILCAFLQGVMLCGVITGMFATLSYGLDAFRNLSSEMFIMNMLFKNFMFYGLSNFANPWVESAGPTQIMYTFGGTTIFMALLAVPVYIFGKRLRSWWARHDLFKKLGLQKTGLVIEMG